jgi:hypothetical protein
MSRSDEGKRAEERDGGGFHGKRPCAGSPGPAAVSDGNAAAEPLAKAAQVKAAPK